MICVTWSIPSLWLYGSRFQNQGICLLCSNNSCVLSLKGAGQGRLRADPSAVCRGCSAQRNISWWNVRKPVRKHFMMINPPPEFGAGPCLTLRPGFCSLSSAFIINLWNFPAFHSRIIHAAVGLTRFWFQLPCKILERGIFCLSTFAAQVFPEKYKWRLFKR